MSISISHVKDVNIDAKTVVDTAVSKVYADKAGRPKQHLALANSLDRTKWTSDLSLTVSCTT